MIQGMYVRVRNTIECANACGGGRTAVFAVRWFCLYSVTVYKLDAVSTPQHRAVLLLVLF